MPSFLGGEGNSSRICLRSLLPLLGVVVLFFGLGFEGIFVSFCCSYFRKIYLENEEVALVIYLFAFSYMCLYENMAFRKACGGYALSEQNGCLRKALKSSSEMIRGIDHATIEVQHR